MRRCRILIVCGWAFLGMGVLQADQTPRQEKAEFFRLLDLNNLSLTNWNKELLAVGVQLTNAAVLSSDAQALGVYASAMSNLLANIPAHPYSCGRSRVLADSVAFTSNFISWLDLDYPGLETVKANAGGGNDPAALVAWRDYTVQKFRRINSPQLYQQSQKGTMALQGLASLLLGEKTYDQYISDSASLSGGVPFYEIYGMSGAPGTIGPISWTNQPPTADTALDVLFGYNSFTFASPLLFRYWRGTALASGTNLTLTCSGTQVTARFAVSHGLTNGAYVTVYSATPTNYNGLFQVAVVNPTTVTYTAQSPPGISPASGSGRALAPSRDPLPLRKWFEIVGDYSTRHKNMISALQLVEASAGVRSQYRTIYESADWGIRAGAVLGQSGRLSELLAALALFSKMLPEESLIQRDWYAGIEKPNDATLLPGAAELIPQESLARVALSLMADTSEALMLAYLRVGMTPNQRLHGLTSLYLLSTFFDEFKAAPELLRQTDAGLGDYAATMFYPDGPMLERSPNYNEGDADKIRMLLSLAATQTTTGLVTLANKLDSYQRVFAFMQTPLGGLPRMASYCTPNPPALWKGGAILSSWRTTFRASVAAATDPVTANLYAGLLDSGLPVPSGTSAAFPYAGYYTLRNGWGSRAHFLYFANTPPGNGHRQMDNNGIQVCAFGRNMLSTAGPPPYNVTFVDASQTDDYAGFAAYQGESSSFKVNTVAVDGRSQNAGFTYNGTVTNVTMPGLWYTSPTFDYVEGTYSGGYGNGTWTGYYNPFTNSSVAVKTVTHKRSVAFLRSPGLWIVTDVLLAADSVQHDYRQIWNFPAYSASYGPTYGFATNEVVSSSSAQRIDTTDADGPNVHLYHLGPQPVTYETYAGCRSPYLGWAGNGIGGLRLPAANVHAVWKGVGTQMVVTVIAPSDVGAASPVLAIRTNSASASAIDFVLDLANGHTLRIAQGLQARTLTVGNRSLSAQTVIVDTSSDGSLNGFALTAAGFVQTNFSFTASSTNLTPLAEIAHPTNFNWTTDGDWLLPSNAFPQNTPPVIAPIPDQRIPVNTGPFSIPFNVDDNETQATNLTVTVHSLDQTLLPDANISLSGDGTDRTITVTSASGLFGTLSVELTVTDPEGLSSVTRFVLNVFATQYWDICSATGLQAGNSFWSGAVSNWSAEPSGSATRSVWFNSGNNAVFAATGGTYTVTVSDTQTINDLLFSVAGCTVTGGALEHPHGVLTICTDADAAIVTPLLACEGFAKTGNGLLTLGGLCDYPGDTAVNAGTMRLAADHVLPPTAGLTLGTGKTAGNLVLTNGNQTVRGLTVAGTTNAVTNRIEIASGRTLTVADALAVGGVNAEITALAEVAGGGGIFVVTNEGATVQIGIATNVSNNNKATLNLGELGTFVASLGTTGFLRVGEKLDNSGGGPATLLLAATNRITAGTVGVGEGGRGNLQLLKFGRGATILNARTINLGTGLRDSASVAFATTTGTLTVRGETGMNRAALNLGTGGTTSGSGASNLLDLRGHVCDLLFGIVTIGDQFRSSSPTHTLYFDAGIMDATGVVMARTTGSGTSTSTFSVGGGTVNIGTGGILLSSNAVGVLTITNGSVTTDGDIVKGAGGLGTASLTLNGFGAVLDLKRHVIGSATDPVNALFIAGTLRNLGEFNGGADFVKSSNALLILDGTNTYTGRTLISNGTLRITGTLTNASSVEVFAGAVLDLAGTLAAKLIVNAGGIVNVTNGGAWTIFGCVTNNGLISVTNGTTLRFKQPVVNNGTIDILNGRAEFFAGLTGGGTVLGEPIMMTTRTWTNVTSGTFNWSGAANWDVAGVPANDGTADVVFSNNLSTAAYPYTVTVDAAWAGATGSVHSLTFLSGGSANSGNTLVPGTGVTTLSIGAGGVKLDTNQTWSTRTFNINLNLAASQPWFVEMSNYGSENRYVQILKDIASPPGVNWILGGRGKTQFEAGSSTGFLGQVTVNGYVNLSAVSQYGRLGPNPIVVNNANGLVAAASVAAPRLIFNDLNAGAVTLPNGFVLNLTNGAAMFNLGLGQGPSAFAGTGTVVDFTNTWSGAINSGLFVLQTGYPLWDDRYVFRFSGNNAGLQGPTNFAQGTAITVNRICAVANNSHAWGTNNSLAILAGPANNRLTGTPSSVLATDGNTVQANIRVPVANQGMTGNRNPRTPVCIGLSGTGTVTFAGTIQVDTVTTSNLQSEVHMLRLTAPSNGVARFTGKITTSAEAFGAPMQILGLGDVALFGTNTGFKSQTLIRSGRLLLGSSAAVSTNVPINLGDRVSFPAGGGVRLATTMPVDKVTAWSAGTFTFSSAPTIDGVVPSVGDRVLVKNEVANYERHGIYKVNSATSWSRAADLDEAAEFVYGLRIKVANGTVNAGRAFFLFNQEEIAYAPLVLNSAASGSYAYFGFNDEPSADPDVALLTAAAVTVSNTIVVSANLSSGTSVLGGITAEGSVFAGDVALNRDVQVTAAEGGTVTFAGTLSGTGGITKTGAGTVYLTGTNTYTGPTAVLAGRLVAQSNVTMTNTLSVTAGAGVLAVTGDLSLGAGSQLAVSGTLVRGQIYTVVTWTGTRTGSFALPVVGLPENWHVGYRSGSVVLYHALPGTLIKLL